MFNRREMIGCCTAMGVSSVTNITIGKDIQDSMLYEPIVRAAKRNILVHDLEAKAGNFTKRLLAIMKVVMRRGYGIGADTFGILSELYVSPEIMIQISNWDLTKFDPVNRREIHLCKKGNHHQIFGVNVFPDKNLGQHSRYQQLYYDLGCDMPEETNEVVVGIDATKGTFKKEEFLLGAV